MRFRNPDSNSTVHERLSDLGCSAAPSSKGTPSKLGQNIYPDGRGLLQDVAVHV